MTVISNSKLKTFTRCQRMYFYKYVLNLQAKQKRDVLERGTLVHACLEEYYRNDFDPKKMAGPLKDYKKKLKKMFDEEAALYAEIPGQVAQILRRYHNHWKDANRFEVANYDGEPIIERAFIIPVTSKVEIGMTLDMAVIDKMGHWVFDNKTAKKIPSDDFRTTDSQSALYEWGYEEVTGKKTKGIIWNYLRTKLPTVPELLKGGTLSRRANIDTDQYTYIKAVKAVEQDPEDYMDFIKTLPTSKNFYNRIRCPRNPRMIKETLEAAIITGTRIANLEGETSPKKYVRSISFMCDRGCEFRSLCMADMMGLDTKFMLKAQYEPRKEDKYDHKIEEED